MRSGIWSVATTRYGCWTLISSAAGSGLLISMLEKLSLFRLTGLVTLELRCWNCLSLLNWIGALTLSLGSFCHFSFSWTLVSFSKCSQLWQVFSDRLRHIRRVIARARLCTRLNHLETCKKSTPCLMQKALTCAADRTSYEKSHMYLLFIGSVV